MIVIDEVPVKRGDERILFANDVYDHAKKMTDEVIWQTWLVTAVNMPLNLQELHVSYTCWHYNVELHFHWKPFGHVSFAINIP